MHVVDTRSAARDSEPDPIMVTAPLAGQRQGRVVQEEEPLKLSPRRHAREPAVRRRLLHEGAGGAAVADAGCPQCHLDQILQSATLEPPAADRRPVSTSRSPSVKGDPDWT